MLNRINHSANYAKSNLLTQFFDGENSVLVMDDNPAIQKNRLNLLGLLRNHARAIADFGEIVKGQ